MGLFAAGTLGTLLEKWCTPVPPCFGEKFLEDVENKETDA
jgi:hypothetical protein